MRRTDEEEDDFRVEEVTLFNWKFFRALLPGGIQAAMGGTAPGGRHILSGIGVSGRPAGVIWGVPDRKKDVIYIRYLYVAELFRSRGAGEALLRELCRKAEKMGYRSVCFRFIRRDRETTALDAWMQKLPGRSICLETQFRAEDVTGIQEVLKSMRRTPDAEKRELLTLEKAAEIWSPAGRENMEKRAENFKKQAEEDMREMVFPGRKFWRERVFLPPLLNGTQGWCCRWRETGRPCGWLVFEEKTEELLARVIFVEPESRGSGVMAQLAERFLEYAVQRGKSIVWHVKYWNAAYQRGILKYALRLNLTEIREDILKIIPLPLTLDLRARAAAFAV